MPTYECTCGARYRFSDEHAGRKSKCKKCAAVFTLTGDQDPIPLAEEAGGGLMIEAVEARQAGVGASVLPPSEAPSLSATVSRDRDDEGLKRSGYWRDMLWTLLFAAHPHDLTVFGTVCVIVTCLEGFFGFTGILFIGRGLLLGLVWVIYKGWYASVRFQIVESAAAGDEHLPSLLMTSDWIDDYLIPAIQWAGSWVFVMIPAFQYTAYYFWTMGPAAWTTNPGFFFSMPWPTIVDDPMFWFFVAGGFVLWPMAILCVAIEGLSALTRVDLMVLTIVKTLPVYVLTVVIVFGADVGGIYLQEIIYTKLAPRPFGGGTAPMGDRMVAAAASNIVVVYATFVAMRAIGLYYHHFKKRFAWSWG